MIVFPLIALMVDQVQNLRHEGVKVIIISSGTRDIKPKCFRVTEGALQTASPVFCSPEAIAHSTKWREVLDNTVSSGCVYCCHQ